MMLGDRVAALAVGSAGKRKCMARLFSCLGLMVRGLACVDTRVRR